MLGRRLLRILATLHLIVGFGQPVFVGVYMSGDFDGLAWHRRGADALFTIGLLQLVVAVVVLVRVRRRWPLLASIGLVAIESVQYFAGDAGALWLHVPLGVITVCGIVVFFLAAWLLINPEPANV